MFVSIDDSKWIWALDQLCTLVFFTTFSQLVLFWVEIIHHAKYHERSKLLRPLFVALNVIVYVLVAVLVVLKVIEMDKHAAMAAVSGTLSASLIPLLDLVDRSFYIGLSFVLALLFVIYGVRLFSLLKSNPIRSLGRTAKLREVGSITPICAASFALRGVMRLLMILPVDWLEKRDLQDRWWFIFTFYAVAEVMPSLLVLFVLRKMPPRYSKSAVNINNATYGATGPSPASQPQKPKLPQQFTAVSRSRV